MDQYRDAQMERHWGENPQVDPPTVTSASGISEIAAPVGSLSTGELLGWLREKITEADKTLKTREEMARTWRSGTNAEWKAGCAIHPMTAGRALKKAERLQEAARHDRIAVKLRRELEMFKAVAEALSHPNGSDQPPARG